MVAFLAPLRSVSQPLVDPEPGVFRYHPRTNATEWIGSPRGMRHAQRSLLFVHGMNYASPREVVRDFIVPCLEAAGLSNSAQAGQINIYFVWWRSSFSWLGLLAEMEARCRVVAHYIEPFYEQLTKSSGPHKPIVISHSLGGFIWSAVATRLAQANRAPAQPGAWWNFQPAVRVMDYLPGGQFSRVHDVFHGACPHSQMTLFHSRRDPVLGLIYPLGSGGIAAGFAGTRLSFHRQLDVTALAQDAHGQAKVSRRGGCFFQRIAPVLKSVACELMGQGLGPGMSTTKSLRRPTPRT